MTDRALDDLARRVLLDVCGQEYGDAIEELPLIYRDILYLQCVEGYKLTEISKLIGIGTETVKKRAQRGRKILLDQLMRGHSDDDA